MSLNWYALRIKPNSEGLSSAALGREGLDVYSPAVLSPCGEADFVSKPLFPGYLFLRFDMECHDMHLVSGLPGILGWVRFGGAIPAIPDGVVAELKERVALINESGGLWERFQPGDSVQVLSGKMESLGEVLESAKSPHENVRVLLDFMGRMVPAQVPWNSLRPVNQDSVTAGSKRGRRTRGRGRWVRGFGPRDAVTA